MNERRWGSEGRRTAARRYARGRALLASLLHWSFYRTPSTRKAARRYEYARDPAGVEAAGNASYNESTKRGENEDFFYLFIHSLSRSFQQYAIFLQYF